MKKEGDFEVVKIDGYRLIGFRGATACLLKQIYIGLKKFMTSIGEIMLHKSQDFVLNIQHHRNLQMDLYIMF